MSESQRKTICLEPNDNSIAFTCKKVLEKYYDIIDNADANMLLTCSDEFLTYDKTDTEFYFKDKYYYPKPIKDTICIKKPADGSASRGISYEIYTKDIEDFVFQRHIQGDEYTIDCWYFDGQLKNFAVRKRKDVWNGLSMKSEFTNEYDCEIENILKEIIGVFTSINVEHGIMNVQFIRDIKGNFWLTEINPRPCANMCYGDDDNFILNFVRASFGEPYQTNKIKIKELRRYLGWEIL